MEETDTDRLLLEIQDEQEALGKVFKALRDKQEVIYHPEWVENYNIKLAILKWNVERNNFGFNLDNEIKMISDEYEEAENANNEYEFLDEIGDCFVVHVGTLAKSSLVAFNFNNELVAWYEFYKDIPRKMEMLGYDFEKCMKENIKKINSRKQEPEQKARWEKDGIPLGEKWEKDPASSKYSVDFSRCKL